MHSAGNVLRFGLPVATALMLVVVSAGLAVAQEGEPSQMARIQQVNTQGGVFVALMRGATEDEKAHGFLVRATDAPGKAKGEGLRAVCELPADEAHLKTFRVCLMPVFKKEGKATQHFRVVTWHKEGTKEAAHKRPMPADLKEVRKQAIDAEFAVTIKPIWAKVEEGAKKGAKVKALEVVALTAAKPEKPTGEVKPTAKESLAPMTEEKLKGSKPIEFSRIELALPEEPSPKVGYGVMLIPRWKEDGRTLQGFDAVLVEVPKPSEGKQPEGK